MAVSPMVSDELAHRNALALYNITLVDSSMTIDEISCGDKLAEAVITENAVFVVNGSEIQEEVEHTLLLFLDESGAVRISGDGYKENTSNFISCSYVDPEKLYDVDDAGSMLCLTAVAKTQIGEGEDASGATKYGVWFTEVKDNGVEYDATDWCAMFVYWCAYHANISSSTILDTASVPIMRDFFYDQGRFYVSKAWDSSTTFTPQEGDIVFISNTPDHPYHVGIITAVSNGVVYYIDGNSSQNGGDVRSTYASLTWSAFVGYGRPSYASYSHTPSTGWRSDSNHHWHLCSNCGEKCSLAAHSYAWDWNTVTHTKYCTACNHLVTSSHYFLTNGEGKLVCGECGYEKDSDISINACPDESD